MSNKIDPNATQKRKPIREFEPQMASAANNADAWINKNKATASRFRKSLDIVLEIYDLAESFLTVMLIENPEKDKLTLPIDVRKLAEKCNFNIQIEDFSCLQKEKNDRTYSPVAQLQMRSRLAGDDKGQITGTIGIADYLGETSVRFSIAHELAHYVLRKHNPIGLNYLHEACPGMYPLSDSDELLSDLLAYAILLPYSLFEEVKQEYEADNSRWPIDFSDWIVYLRDKMQMPEYHVVLAYQSIKQCTIARRLNEAEKNTPQWLQDLINYLLGAHLSKSEIKGLLSYQKAEKEAAKIQERLAETIETVHDKTRFKDHELSGDKINQNSEKKCKLSNTNCIEGTELQDSFIEGNHTEILDSSLEMENLCCIEDWKAHIIHNLFSLGMSDKELNDVSKLINVPLEFHNNED